jgi:hypothetical protein
MQSEDAEGNGGAWLTIAGRRGERDEHLTRPRPRS